MRPRALQIACAALAAACAFCSPASAARPAENPHGKLLGAIPSRSAHAPATRFAAPLAPDASGNLDYHGGPVMHSSTTYAIYWEPPGYSFPAGYRTTIDGFLANVAADSGKPTNVYSVGEQYTDSTGNAAYQSSFAGSTVVTDPLPTQLCTDPGTTACVTDAQLQAEIDQVLTANSLPRDLSHAYFIFTPQGVGSCYDSSSCAYDVYCAYHSDFTGTGTTIYGNLPYPDPSACGSDQSPNGTPADDTIDSLSHEHNEAITDPLGDAWWDDYDGSENGDKCAWSFGAALGGSTAGGTSYNQYIAGGRYHLQEEWDNATRSCRLRMAAAPATAAFAYGPAAPASGDSVAFDGSGSQPAAGTAALASEHWDFGDGSGADGTAASHTFTRPGTYSVTLTVTDIAGGTGTLTRTVSVANRAPTASLRIATSAPLAGQQVIFDGRGSSDPDGAVASYRWDFGDGASGTGSLPAHAYRRPGTYTIALTVTDDSGAASARATQQVTIGKAPPPVARFKCRCKPVRAGTRIVFDGRRSRARVGRIVRWRWSFGDRGHSRSRRPSHRYRRAGWYRVKLTVTDALGHSATSSRRVHVVGRRAR